VNTEALGRIRVSLKAETPAEPVQQREEIPRVVRLLALSHRWHRLIDEGKVKDQAEIARRMGLTRARVSQIMALRWLSPVMQEWMIASEEPIAGEKEWRVVAVDVRWSR
jgi:hypothetical protein